VLLAAATFFVFFEVRDHDFVDYDDPAYILDNPNFHTGPSLEAAIRAFTTPHETNWIPLTWISLQIDYALYGADPTGYHLTNVALHALSSLLLFLVLSRMTGARWRSAFVAAVFAVHPLHVESVAWAAERKDALSGLLWMLTLHAYAGYAEHPGSRLRYAGVLACLALGLLAKPMLVTLPFVLLLLDYWPLGRLRADPSRRLPEAHAFRRALVEKLPMLLLVAAASAVTFAVQRSTGAMSHDGMLPFQYRLMNAANSYVVYIAKSFWPSDLAVFYPHPLRTVSALGTAGSALLLATVTFGTARLAASRPYLVVGWLWYLGTLVPVIGLVQVGQQCMADRYTYLPLIGLFLMAVWGVADLTVGWRHRRIGLAASAGIVILGCMAGTWFQVGHWQSGLTLLTHTLKVTESNALAHNNLGGALAAQGRTEEAISHYREAIRIDPKLVSGHNNLGVALMKTGKPEEAIAHYQEALRIDPENAAARTNLGSSLKAKGRVEEAITQYQEAARIKSDDPRPYNNLAWIRATHPDPRFRDGARAVEFAEKACGLWGYKDPGFLDTLAAAYAEAGRFPEAVATAQKAVSLAASLGSREVVREFEERLQGYEAGCPYREAPPPPEESGP
jgi:Flp pilus assembly protein TadD